MIIGGASIYKQLLPYTNKMLLTEVDSECIDADAYFPEFNKNEWDSSIISSHITEDNISYKHLVYKRKRWLFIFFIVFIIIYDKIVLGG